MARFELTKSKAREYHHASKKRKGMILDKYSTRSKQVLSNAWVLSGRCCGKYFKAQIDDGLLDLVQI